MTDDKTNASKLIDERISELPDWRGKTLGKVRGIIKKASKPSPTSTPRLHRGPRAIDIKENEKIDEEAMKNLIREAVAMNLDGKK